MTANEAIEILFDAKWVMSDMGMTLEARDTEDAEMLLRMNPSPALAKQRADYLLPLGRYGRAWLVLLSPDRARARAFTAAVLRAVE